MEIKRDIYLNQLNTKKHNGMIKIITGLRRSGKSYLLFNLFYKMLMEQGIPSDHIIKIQLDDLDNIAYREKIKLYQFIKSQIVDSQMYYCLLDEIQLVDGFEEVLNSLLHIQDVDVYVTGSNSRFLVKDVVTEFRGRGDEIRIYPLSFQEFFSVRDDDFETVWADYYTYGGLPFVASLNTHKEKSDYLKSLFTKVYITDVADRYKIRNKKEFEDLLNVLASCIGSLTNPARIENTFKSKEKSTITNKTITSYIGFLDDAFLIQTANRYDIKGRKYIGANKKYYFTENIIYNELRIKGFDVDIGVIEGYSNDGKNKSSLLECDFVANKGTVRVYIQSMFDAPTPDKLLQEQKSLLKISDSFRKVIIQKSAVVPHYNENGIFILSLKDFLLGDFLNSLY